MVVIGTFSASYKRVVRNANYGMRHSGPAPMRVGFEELLLWRNHALHSECLKVVA